MKNRDYSDSKDTGVVIAAMITSFIIFGMITYSMYKYIIYLDDNKLIQVPDLYAESYEEMCDKYLEDFSIKAVDEQLSNVYEVGSILSQNIEAGTMVRKGTEIEVSISKNPNSLIMPELEARTIRDAQKTLEKYNVEIETVLEESKIIEAGYIIRTSPAYEEKLKLGQKVTLFISAGSSDVTDDDNEDEKAKDNESDEENISDDVKKLPNFVGMTEEEARNTAQKLDIKIEKIEYKNGANSKEGTVTWQSVKKDTPLNKVQSINFLITLNESVKDTNKTNNEDSKQDNNIDTEDIEEAQTKLTAVQIAPDFELTKASYVVEIILQDSSGTRPIYRKEHTVADFPFEKRFNVEVSSTISAYVDQKLILEKTIN